MSSGTIRSSAQAAAYYQQHGYPPGAINRLIAGFGDLSLHPRQNFMEVDYGDEEEEGLLNHLEDKNFSDTSSFGTANYSDISDDGIELAEQADREYYRPTLFVKLEKVFLSKTAVINMIGVCILGGIFLRGLSTEEQAKEAGFKLGNDRAVSSIECALDYIDKHAHKNISSLFTYILTKRG